FSDHDIRRLNRHSHRIVHLQAHVFDRSIRNGCDKFEVADLHGHLRHGLPLGDLGHGSLKLVTRTEFHIALPRLSRIQLRASFAFKLNAPSPTDRFVFRTFSKAPSRTVPPRFAFSNHAIALGAFARHQFQRPFAIRRADGPAP